MAGMLPGVEAARRRRFHKSNDNNNNNNNESRRGPSSFCLYATSHDHQYHSSNPPTTQVSRIRMCCDERLDLEQRRRLGAAATDAKNRLDHRLQLRSNSQSNLGNLKRSALKRLSWWKLIISWRSWEDEEEEEEEECAVCLERLHFLQGDEILLMQLPCAHRFHTNCLLPWLEAKPHCPCCRLQLHPSS